VKWAVASCDRHPADGAILVSHTALHNPCQTREFASTSLFANDLLRMPTDLPSRPGAATMRRRIQDGAARTAMH
jgi:hypothetical protein